MIDGVILLAIVIFGMACIFQMMISVISSDGGTKGISKDVHYGRKTGKQYTADKSREQHLVPKLINTTIIISRSNTCLQRYELS